ncbi:Uncharacterized protein TCM_001704 [Theobroma cacao]|uniref:Retrotransposon gag domain-containing protein n=1 Tax=Theobroma cacao TaxID=3641 RepID=A0A061DJI4_THECC|nr:Uncharacterized protein TCM_001704 [Theobroma cacao]
MMTRRTRNAPSSPQFSAESSATRSKHHRKIPYVNYYYSDDNYVDNTSLSHSPDESNGDDLEQPRNENDYDDFDASDFQSESMTNAPNAPKTLLRGNGLSAAASLNSVSNSAIWSRSNLIEATSYINIAPLPIFQGSPSDCPVTHLSRFAKVCRANNVSSVDMMMRIFPVTLENEAGLWYDLNIEPYPSLRWEEIKSSFLQAYHKTQVTEQLRHELMMINQGSEERVRSYFLRLQWSLQRWPDHGIPENLLKEIFVDGLREDFQDWIVPQKPDSLVEALRLAIAFEQLKSIKISRKKDLKCDFCEGSHEERNCQVRERMKELWRKTKDKEWMDSSEKNQSNEAVNESAEGSAEDRIEEENVVEGEMLSGRKQKKKSPCQCCKHQCWKKQLDRTNSLVSRNSDAV